MLGIVLDRPTETFNFTVTELPDLTPGPGQVLVEVSGSSVNPVDAKNS